ncbi:MAG: flavodoxin family protein [Eggerthellaceae bacterium]|nr:flavodoxin family protein [Eggerthellaceae bacterium]
MHRLIIAGSPRPDGRSAHLADELFNVCIDECPGDGVSIVSVASTSVAPCTGCDACRAERPEPPAPPAEGDPLSPCAAAAASDAGLHQCVIDDDMAEVRKHLDAADELIVVSPVYFASAPAQLKALLDRLQPYYWSDARRQPARPAVLHVVGEGGDPHGFEPLVGTVRSALAVAGFRLELVLDWVGRITSDGEITDEADEYEVAVDADDDLEAAAPAPTPVADAPRERPRLALDDPQPHLANDPAPAGRAGRGRGDSKDARGGKGGKQGGARKGKGPRGGGARRG